jgi:hypothetical protein
MQATAYLLVGSATHVRKFLSEVSTLGFHALTPLKREARAGKLSETLQIIIIIIIIIIINVRSSF